MAFNFNVIRCGGYLIAWLRLASGTVVPIAMPIRQAMYYLESLGQLCILADGTKIGGRIVQKAAQIGLKKLKEDTLTKADANLDRYQIYAKILQRNHDRTNSPALRDGYTIRDSQRDEINAGFAMVTHVETAWVPGTTNPDGTLNQGGLNLILTFQHPDSTEAAIETFFISTADLPQAMEVILQALQGIKESYPVEYRGKTMVTLPRDFRDPPPDPGAGSSDGVTVNLLLTDSILNKKIPNCFSVVSEDPVSFKDYSSLSTPIFTCFSFLLLFLSYAYYYLNKLKKLNKK